MVKYKICNAPTTKQRFHVTKALCHSYSSAWFSFCHKVWNINKDGIIFTSAFIALHLSMSFHCNTFLYIWHCSYTSSIDMFIRAEIIFHEVHTDLNNCSIEIHSKNQRASHARNKIGFLLLFIHYSTIVWFSC